MKRRTSKIAAKPVWSASNKARITKLILKWRGLLLLNGYEVIVRFENVESADKNTAAELTGNYPYRCGYIVTFYPCFLCSSPYEMERKVIHELVHIISRGLKGAAHDLVSEKLVLWRDIVEREEAMVDWIATILHLSCDK